MHCDECAFVYEEVPAGAIASRLREYGARYRTLLEPLIADVERFGRRPAPDVWSVQEYAAHVRDVLTVQRERVLLALVEDTPDFPPMYRDERVALAAYAEEDPGRIVTGLALAAELLAHLYDRLTPEQLARSLIYNYPTRTERDLLWVGRHTVHECAHHLGDVERDAQA